MIPAHGGGPYGPQVPVLCMDGQPVQLPEETRVPLAATKDYGSGSATNTGGRERRWFGDIETLREETAAWSSDVNASQRGVDWQMKLDDARCKLKSAYPTMKTWQRSRSNLRSLAESS